jgi:hypothetical protein
MQGFTRVSQVGSNPRKQLLLKVVNTYHYAAKPGLLWVARFFLGHGTKTGKMYQMNRNVPNVHRMSQMSVKYSKYP